MDKFQSLIDEHRYEDKVDPRYSTWLEGLAQAERKVRPPPQMWYNNLSLDEFRKSWVLFAYTFTAALEEASQSGSYNKRNDLRDILLSPQIMPYLILPVLLILTVGIFAVSLRASFQS